MPYHEGDQKAGNREMEATHGGKKWEVLGFGKWRDGTGWEMHVWDDFVGSFCSRTQRYATATPMLCYAMRYEGDMQC